MPEGKPKPAKGEASPNDADAVFSGRQAKDLGPTVRKLRLRTRLGAMIAALSLGTHAAEAQTHHNAAPQSVEQATERMVSAANHGTQEVAYGFVTPADGRERVALIDEANPHARDFAGFEPDAASREVGLDMHAVATILEDVRGGASARIVHSHPSEVMRSLPGAEQPHSGFDRVPPSPDDVLLMLTALSKLDASARDRLTFEVVTEGGTWQYSASTEAVERWATVFNAGGPLLRSLETPDLPRLQHRLADCVRRQFGRDGQNHATWESIAERIESRTYLADLIESPVLLNNMETIIPLVIGNPDTPSDVRAFLTTLQEADRVVGQAAERADPEGILSRIPNFGHLDEYQHALATQGIILTFVPSSP